ncbi:MAG: hypothetical protein JWM57_3014 [Phycisphaerales bacterium]|nr:hypothetical protein [Phycisphaerales bacterium]
MNFTTFRTTVSLSVLTVAAIMGGCTNGNHPSPFVNDSFRPDDEARNVDNIFAQQRANGAREDGTLYSQHFTNGKLNSLGYQKLSAMAYGPETGKLAIFLDVPKGDAYETAHDSVAKALARGGIAEDAYTITAGANPGVSAPAEPGLAALAAQHAGSAAPAAGGMTAAK